MKLISILAFLLVANSSFAEVKPDGALVPAECGENQLIVAGGPEVPTEVCIYDVAGQNTQVVGIKTTEDVLYFEVNQITIQDGIGIYNVTPASAEKDERGYMIYQGTTTEIASDNMFRKGNMFLSPMFMFKVELVMVFNTLSVD